MEINEIDDLDNIWISNAFVRINYRRGNIVMVANKEGFLSLSNMFKSMAENGISDDTCGFVHITVILTENRMIL